MLARLLSRVRQYLVDAEERYILESDQQWATELREHDRSVQQFRQGARLIGKSMLRG